MAKERYIGSGYIRGRRESWIARVSKDIARTQQIGDDAVMRAIKGEGTAQDRAAIEKAARAALWLASGAEVG